MWHPRHRARHEQVLQPRDSRIAQSTVENVDLKAPTLLSNPCHKCAETLLGTQRRLLSQRIPMKSRPTGKLR